MALPILAREGCKGITLRALDRWPVTDSTEFVLPWTSARSPRPARVIARLLVKDWSEPGEAELAAAVALVRGLRHAMASRTTPLPVPDALMALRRGLAGILPDRVDPLHSRQ